MTETNEILLGHARLQDFLFRKDYVNLNHGSYGSYPTVVRDAANAWRAKIEECPDIFMRIDFAEQLRLVREKIAKILNAETDDVTFVQNATTGVNAVLRSLEYTPESNGILYFSTIYGSCGNTVEFLVDNTNGLVKSHEIPLQYPVSDADILAAFEDALKNIKGLKVAVFDLIISLPGVMMPWQQLVQLCKRYNVLSLCDAAHGIGHLPIDVKQADPDFLISNCHKWLHSMRATAILYAPKRTNNLIHSMPIGHGYLSQKRKDQLLAADPDKVFPERTFQTEFHATGTLDYAAFLAIADAIDYRASLGGEDRIITYCTDLAKRGGALIASIIGTETMAVEADICMVNVRLPIDTAKDAEVMDWLARCKWFYQTSASEFNVMFSPFVHEGTWYARFSAQVYNELRDFEYCGKVIKELCDRIRTQQIQN